MTMKHLTHGLGLMIVAAITVGFAQPARGDQGPATVTINQISPRTFSPNGDSQEDSTSIDFCLDNAANVTATAANSSGVQIRTFAYQTSYPSGCQSLPWDGHDDGGSIVS